MPLGNGSAASVRPRAVCSKCVLPLLRRRGRRLAHRLGGRRQRGARGGMAYGFATADPTGTNTVSGAHTERFVHMVMGALCRKDRG